MQKVNLIEDRYLTVKAVARKLNLPRSKVYQLIQKEEIPFVRINNTYRIPERLLESWIREHLFLPR